ncbi:MAG: hypothetical protein ACWA41_10160 [Putridiphycobacter sp.]
MKSLSILLFLSLSINSVFGQEIIQTKTLDSEYKVKNYYDYLLGKNIRYELLEDGGLVKTTNQYNVEVYSPEFEKKSWEIKLPKSKDFTPYYNIKAKKYSGYTYILQSTLVNTNEYSPNYITKVEPNGSFTTKSLIGKFNAVLVDFYFAEDKMIFIYYDKNMIVTIRLFDLDLTPLNIDYKLNSTLESGQDIAWHLMYYKENLFYFLGKPTFFNNENRDENFEYYKEIYLENNAFNEVTVNVTNDTTEIKKLIFYDSIFYPVFLENSNKIFEREKEFRNKLMASSIDLANKIIRFTSNSRLNNAFRQSIYSGKMFDYYYNDVNDNFYLYYFFSNYIYYVVLDQSDEISFVCGMEIIKSYDPLSRINVDDLTVKKYIGTWGNYPSNYNYKGLDYAIKNNLTGQLTILDNENYQLLIVDNIKEKTSTVYKIATEE